MKKAQQLLGKEIICKHPEEATKAGNNAF